MRDSSEAGDGALAGVAVDGAPAEGALAEGMLGGVLADDGLADDGVAGACGNFCKISAGVGIGALWARRINSI